MAETPGWDGRLGDRAKSDLQGFATSGYGHLLHTAYLFVRMQDGTGAAKWVAGMIPEITSAAGWRPEPDQPKRRPAEAVQVAFTHGGLAALGLSRRALCSFPRAFSEGMAEPIRAAYILGDVGASSPERWILGGPESPPLSACVLLHAEDPGGLERLTTRILDRISATRGSVVLDPAGPRFGYRRPDGREHFGFSDGIAQPQIEGIKGKGGHDVLPTGEFVLGYPDHYGQIAAGPVVPAEEDVDGLLPEGSNPFHPRGSLKDLGLHGTYVVYRQLAQDVAGFWSFLRGEAARFRQAGGSGTPLLLAAKLIGRWPGGAPLVLAPEAEDPALGARDDFLYSRLDPDGRRCPFGSHIRRSNPRDLIRPLGPTESLNMSNAHRLRRQGSLYGPLLAGSFLDTLAVSEDEVPDDGLERGLHFVALNADIERQFELVQQQWMNNPAFNGVSGNPDPMAACGGQRSGGRMILPLERGAWRTAPLPSLVTVRAGAYLFLPGMRALRFLASGV